MSYMEQWTALVMQLAKLQQAMTEIDHDSPYYDRARKYCGILTEMLKEAWMTDVISIHVKPDKPRRAKVKQGRTPVPYINNAKDRQRIVDILANIITTRFCDGEMHLLDGFRLSTPRFFAYTYSALHEAGIPEKDNLKAFCAILQDAVDKSETSEIFTTEYTAIYDAMKKWNDWTPGGYHYDFVHISELSVNVLDDIKKRQKLLRAKQEYAQVVEVLRDEHLISPAENIRHIG